ncbi:short-chain dehydrogenase/reductase [Streptomyces tateyamensis]|uniref:Short-chain dehydrogenase/reductase n=1 Tax=Streptomyces tateyamensis TaxID=565073 RepID=A0A2V4NDI0_9ACTN|nr:SDR family oxidoreductase [Streptomyces tateyamensis]PYC78239.1 short-chain dehydrogenase/reductase [Streptomyces tateyamensis]
MTRRWLVTGGSAGLGLALVRAVLAAGEQVVATGRRLGELEALTAEYPDQLLPFRMEALSAADCTAAVQACTDRFGGLDVLVNNAGAGIYGAVEEVSDEELRGQLELLAITPWRLARLALPLMRAQGSGHIVNVSSLAGRIGFTGLGAYVAGKYALEGMSATLAAEVAPFGIRVTVVEPGGFATGYGTAMQETAQQLPEYREALAPMRAGLRGMAALPGINQPEEFARVVLRAVGAEQGPLRLPAGPDAFGFLTAVLEADRAELAAAQALAEQPAGA